MADIASGQINLARIDDGVPSLVYSIVLNTSTVESDPSGAFTPDTLYAKGYQFETSDGKLQSTASAGTIRCDASTDGLTWVQVSSASGSISVPMLSVMTAVPNAKFVRFILLSGSSTTWAEVATRTWGETKAYSWSMGSGYVAQTDVRVVESTGNYLVKDSTGLYVCSTEGDTTKGNALKLSDTLLAFLLNNIAQTQITPTGIIVGPESGVHVSILSSGEIIMANGTTTLFDATASGISLGANSTDAIIKFCDGTVQISTEEVQTSTGNVLAMSMSSPYVLVKGGKKVIASVDNGITGSGNKQSNISVGYPTDTEDYMGINAYVASAAVYSDIAIIPNKISIDSATVNINGYPAFNAKSLNGYPGLNMNGDDSTYVRTTSSGILPYQSGGSSRIGTFTWPFQAGYFNNLYNGGVKMPKIFTGSKVLTASDNSARMWTGSQFANDFGRAFDNSKDFVGVMNADGGSSGAHCQDCTLLGINLYATFDQVVNGLIRVNYIVALGI